ncbi:hypothetical protein BH09SUM1_BH09SUM1_03530 [soil metagenome]
MQPDDSRREFLKGAALIAGGALLSGGLPAGAQPAEAPAAAAPSSGPLSVRAYLMHITHYDPAWEKKKDTEEKFSIAAAIKVLDALKAAGMNMLIVDIEDGVEYASHPEMKKHYSVPIADLKTLSMEAASRGLLFVPKLNFSKSGRNLHDKWMTPHWDLENFLAKGPDYWPVAEDVIAEIVETTKPTKFFHIGMDEDHHRSLNQYVTDINRLHGILTKHNLRPIVWNDTCYEGRNVIAEVHADKMRAAEPRLPKDIVHLTWDYDIFRKGIVERLAKQGFEVWHAPGRDKDKIRGWGEIVRKEGGSGLVMTHWIKCSDQNEEKILKLIEKAGETYAAA